MLLLCNKLNEVLNLLCKLVGHTHCDATSADSMQYRYAYWYWYFSLTEMEFYAIGLIIYRY